MELWIFQCSDQSEPLHLFLTWFKPDGNLSVGSNVTRAGNTYFNYTLVYWNSRLYSQITAHYRNFFVMFGASPARFILSRSVMLRILYGEIDLLNFSNPYIGSW